VQRLPLDVVVSSTNLTGATVANLDDDPDSPDANWATATSVADTSLRAGFPTPPGDPTQGPDLQEFRVLLRKDAAGGNDPTYDLELWESGGGALLWPLASGVTLSSDTGEVVSATWDASLLGTADGSAVELVIVGNRSGGSPSSRRTVEVGAVEWNVDFGVSSTGNDLDDDGDTVIDDGCSSIIYVYDNADRLISVVDAPGNSTTYGYDASGNRTSVTDARGKITTYAYDALDRLGSVTDPLSRVTSYEYDEAGNLDNRTDGRGLFTQYGYDPLNRLKDVDHFEYQGGPLVDSVGYTYDDVGNRKHMVDSRQPAAVGSAEAGDDCGGPANPINGSQRLPPDELVSSTNLSGATVANLDDDPDTPDPNWATAATVADTSLQLGFATPSGDPTQGPDLQEFRVLLRKDAAGGNDPTYDLELWESGGWAATLASGVTLSSDTGVVVAATWDAALLGTAAGSAVELVIVGHQSSGLPGEERAVEVGAIEWNVDFVDVSGTGNDVDEDVDGVTDDGCPSAGYAYDALDRLTAVTSISEMGRDTVRYEYDTSGPTEDPAQFPAQRTKINYGDGNSVRYEYLPDGSIGTVTDWLGDVTAHTYYNNGNLLGVLFPTTPTNIGSMLYAYDDADRLTDIVHDFGLGTNSLTYTLDAVGNRDEVDRGSPTVEDYEYDDLYRLEKVTYEDSQEDTYTYDDVGNRLTKNSIDYSYDDANQLIDVEGTAYSYDANGNLEGRGAESYVYDSENRLDRIVFDGFDPDPNPCYDIDGNGFINILDVLRFKPGFGSSAPGPPYDPFYDLEGDGDIDILDILKIKPQFLETCPRYFQYDGDGLRTSSTFGKYITFYAWDMAGGLPVLLRETVREFHCEGDPCENVPRDIVVPRAGVRAGETTYVYGLDPSTGSGQALISATDEMPTAEDPENPDTVRRYYFTDGLGSTVTTVSSDGEDRAFEYDVFGEPRSGDPESETFLFTGEQYDARARDVRLIDADTGLYYLRARYYDPDIGRFLTQDPVPAVNLYAYVGNNPVNFVDPSGLCIPEINCPPGLGGGTQPPSLPKSKEGSSFRLECSIEAWLPFTGGVGKLNRIQLTQAFVYDGSTITRVDDPVVAEYARRPFWHSSNLTSRWYWHERGRLARSEARVTWTGIIPGIRFPYKTINVWIVIDFTADGSCTSYLVK
jgi:RHS repeat-associated protein